MPAKPHTDDLGLLQEAGPLLFGVQWRIPLADALGVTPRTLRNWEAHNTATPSDLRPRLRRVFERQQVAKARELDHLRRMFGAASPDDSD